MTLRTIIRELAAEVRRDAPKPLEDAGPEAAIMRTLVRLVHEAETIWTWTHDGYSWNGECGAYTGRVSSTQVNVCELWLDGLKIAREESAEDIPTCKRMVAKWAALNRELRS